MAHLTTNIASAAFAALILTTLLSGCYYDVESELYPENNCEVPENVSYEFHIEPIVSASCATPNCHVSGGNANGNFETYDGVLAKVNNGSFEEEVIISQSMPPSGPLPDCQLQLIEAWLSQGAPQ